MKYGLTFIDDKDLFNHVKSTVEKYRAVICLKDFHKNIIDPIKLTFDAHIYQQSWEEIIEGEVIRQLDGGGSKSRLTLDIPMIDVKES